MRGARMLSYGSAGRTTTFRARLLSAHQPCSFWGQIACQGLATLRRRDHVRPAQESVAETNTSLSLARTIFCAWRGQPCLDFESNRVLLAFAKANQPALTVFGSQARTAFEIRREPCVLIAREPTDRATGPRLAPIGSSHHMRRCWLSLAARIGAPCDVPLRIQPLRARAGAPNKERDFKCMGKLVPGVKTID